MLGKDFIPKLLEFIDGNIDRHYNVAMFLSELDYLNKQGLNIDKNVYRQYILNFKGNFLFDFSENFISKILKSRRTFCKLSSNGIRQLILNIRFTI